MHNLTSVLAHAISEMGHSILNNGFFDTLTVKLTYSTDDLMNSAVTSKVNLRKVSTDTVACSLDETITKKELQDLINLFARSSFVSNFQHGFNLENVLACPNVDQVAHALNLTEANSIFSASQSLRRTSKFLTHPVFNSYHSETDMLRYINYLQKKDLSLADAMIPLGSCTMKLNATTEMIPVTFPEFGNLHPFVPLDQAEGYTILLKVNVV